MTTRADGQPRSEAIAPTDRGRRRREAVLDVAEHLFHEHGFHGVSVDELGAAAGITGPGLYRHFPSKDALLMAVLDRIWVHLKPAIDRADGLPAQEGFDVLVDAQLDLALERPAALVLLVRELRHLPDEYRDLALRNHQRYVTAWEQVLAALRPRLPAPQVRAIVLALHGLIDAAALRPRLAPELTLVEHRALLRELVIDLVHTIDG